MVDLGTWLVLALVGGVLVWWASRKNSGCGVMLGLLVGVLLIGLAVMSMRFSVSGTLKLQPTTPTVSAPRG